jgi:hypothetical protein
MKFTITKYELFALTTHLVRQESPNPEHGRKRLRTWGELGVDELADTMSGFGGEITVADWRDKTPFDVELSDGVVDFIIAGLAQPKVGGWADILTRLTDRLEAAKGKR